MEALCGDQREALRTLRKVCEESTIVGLHQKRSPPCSRCNGMWTRAVSKDRCSNWQGCEHLRSPVAPIAWTCTVRIYAYYPNRSNDSTQSLFGARHLSSTIVNVPPLRGRRRSL